MLHSRIERLESLLQIEIGQIIDHDLANPNLPDFITVHRVKLAKDLGSALVLITFLADQTPETIKKTVSELNKAAGFISHEVSQRVTIKRHPKLKFTYSDSTKHALDIEKLFHQIKQESGENEHTPAEAEITNEKAGEKPV